MARKLEGSDLLRNRTYVLRAARMSPHQRKAYTELRTAWVVDPPEMGRFDPVDLGLDGENTPNVLDVGFGMGYALAEMAEHYPHWRIVGVEVYRPGVGKLMSELKRKGVTNVRVVELDAVVALREYLPLNTFDAVHVLFPDPWPKKKHHKRRLVQSGFPELIRPVLKAGGYLHLATDWEHYAYQMAEVLDHSPEFTSRYGGFAPRPDWRIETSFERKAIEQGRTIYELAYVL